MKNILLLSLIICSQTLIAQNVGIGIPVPLSKLHIFNGASGATPFFSTALAVESNTNTYLNLLSPAVSETAILFGLPGNSANGVIMYNNPVTPNGFQFRNNGNLTRMVLNSAGNVGIGNTNPGYLLDVNNRMRIRSGGNNVVSAGLWLNNNANNEAAFIGMEDDTHVGLFGNNGAGFKFGMNTQTGALKINGSEGQTGQVLTSGGVNPPSWGSVSSWLFNNTYQLNQTSTITIPPVTATPTLPGMDNGNLSITITSNSKLIISTYASIKSISCFGCGPSHVGVGTQINGNNFFRNVSAEGNADNGYIITLTNGISIFDVIPGVYTFRTYVFNDFGPSANAECTAGRLFIAVISSGN